MKNSSKVSVLAILINGVFAASSPAEPIEFDFKDPKGVNAISFVLDSKLEPIMGIGSQISGLIQYDPTNPKETTGKITLQANSLQTVNKGMNDALYSNDWLDVETHSTIEFAFKKVRAAKRQGASYLMKVIGDLTCKGVTKEITVEVSASYLPDMLGNRLQGKSGDLLVLRSNFSINRKDFNIKPAMESDVVSEEIELRISIVGAHEKG